MWAMRFGLRAYDPPAQAFPGLLSVINHWWRTPIPPTPYGPFWVATAWLVTAPFGSLLAKVVALRLLGVACIAALIVVMRSLRMQPRMLVLVALNPALYFNSSLVRTMIYSRLF